MQPPSSTSASTNNKKSETTKFEDDFESSYSENFEDSVVEDLKFV